MDDLFPTSLQPDAVDLDVLPHQATVFFAIYPSAEDLPRVTAWQRRICGRTGVALRPPRLLHVSVALCGTPRRLLQPLREALRFVAERFTSSAFELTLDTATGGFGKDGRAFVALADAAGARAVHGLRVALAEAQQHVGLVATRGMSEAHLTLGYGDGLPAERRSVEPLSFRVAAVDLVASFEGRSEHRLLERWPLR
ncbi:2'-5' RNA ligase family protein [Rhodanobacter sp. DHG33]|uniref:2'-5' RNA ligase family protein n=1 Tax=Rhodanobacter sp. DHG33 TaxID=2775921 RepID=UPI00177C326B|nr:2'-5' RNA ligase family protein [Rhodanobacter sp. DHG33]MBD8898959.1 2'-5' RNA ligase family protein [Rhodanobacter sp. DHG33]